MTGHGMALRRRGLLAGSMLAGAGLAAASGMPPVQATPRPGRLLDAAGFGAVGDGRTDDTEALQRALQAALDERRGCVLTIPPGTYRITSGLRIATAGKPDGNLTHGCTIRAHGARLQSAIHGSEPVLEIVGQAVVRYLTVEGLEIAGNGGEGDGLVVSCTKRGRYVYNFCLRDLIVENCGGDGCRLTGNVFEGQMFNCYFRGNRGNGATLAHGPEDTVLSAIHAFGCVFGNNGRHGVELRDGAADVGFQGCYFLLNGQFGLSAPNGCTLLSHCGFENNHVAVDGFSDGDAGIRLFVRGTLIGCTAYSIGHQTHLVRAYLTDDLVLVGCSGGGSGKARDAGLARLQGEGRGRAILVGTAGRIDDDGGVEIVDYARGEAPRFSANWNSPKLLTLGDHRLWIDADGRLRMKDGRPESDTDGRAVGT